MIRHNLEFDMIVRGIVATRGEDGATIAEIRQDYCEISGEQWPLVNLHYKAIAGYLTELDGLVMCKEKDGPYIWYVDDLGNISERIDSHRSNRLDENNNGIVEISTTRSVTTLQSSCYSNSNSDVPAAGYQKRLISTISSNGSLDNQLPKRTRGHLTNSMALIEQNLQIHNQQVGSNGLVSKSTSTEVESSSTVPIDSNNNCLQNGFNIMPSIRNDMVETSTASSSNISKSALSNCNDICVMADNFMRYLISYKLFRADCTNQNLEVFSFCLPGLQTNRAYHTILDSQNFFRSNYKYILINLGAIDILSNRNITDIKSDFVKLLKAIEIIGLVPILTTLPPIKLHPGHPNAREIYQSLLIFNHFILTMFSERYVVIDLFDIFYKAKQTEPNKYYLNIPHRIIAGGENIEIFPWNHSGRMKIIEVIEKTIDAKIPKYQHFSLTTTPSLTIS